jgi:exopolysaccharide biosynthesis protein
MKHWAPEDRKVEKKNIGGKGAEESVRVGGVYIKNGKNTLNKLA